MVLRPIVLLNIAALVVLPALYVAVSRIRGGVAAWKRPLVIGVYLSVLCVTLVWVTGETGVASSPDLALALDAFAVLVALASFVFLGRSWLTYRAGDPADSG